MKNSAFLSVTLLYLLLLSCAETLYTEPFPDKGKTLNKLPEFWDRMYAFQVEDTASMGMSELFNNLVAKEILNFERISDTKGSITTGQYLAEEIFESPPSGISFHTRADTLYYTFNNQQKKAPFRRLHDGFLLNGNTLFTVDLESRTLEPNSKNEPPAPLVFKRLKDLNFLNIYDNKYWRLYVVKDRGDGSIDLYMNNTEKIKDKIQQYTQQFPARIEDDDVVVYPNSNQLLALLDDPDFFQERRLLTLERKPIESESQAPTAVKPSLKESSEAVTSIPTKWLYIGGGLLFAALFLIIILLFLNLLKKK